MNRNIKVYKYIKRFSDAHGYSPTLMEIKKETGEGSLDSILDYLEERNFIIRIKNETRGILIINEDDEGI